ncbi:PREDICTED: arylsulfatase-like [Priapulus caudatus]|uniref:Arylsulfatase-like n=1 Tax=Priapulus caudatus TaxID=37621 RepID=A0ABM1EPF9_PRICU|nr:PREDICTED: arylsulfatase-like [Priapulus caudatus]
MFIRSEMTLTYAHSVVLAFLTLTGVTLPGEAHVSKPNIVVILADDSGWGDLSVYGHASQEWGRLDDMASEGLRFTNFYTSYPICSPSRASLLTGRLPIRTGIYRPLGANDIIEVVIPMNTGGLPADELTIAELLKKGGYRTGMVGKWHLGINKYNSSDGTHLPKNQGFDYVGTNLPFTMAWHCDVNKVHMAAPDTDWCFLYEGDRVVQQPIDTHFMTGAIVRDAVEFIRSNADGTPFFLYYPMTQTHTDLGVMPRFKGVSKNGRYGDNVAEMQWAVGEILDALKEEALEKNTLVIFTSDNGPHLELCEESGSAGILKGGKGQTWDGGVRVPGIAWWPGTITPGRTSKVVLSVTDLLPTFANLAGIKLPDDRIIDGKSFHRVLLGEHTAKVHDILYFYCDERIMAVRYGDFKIHFYTQAVIQTEHYTNERNCVNGVPQKALLFTCKDCDSPCVTAHIPPLIYNIENDPSEKFSLPAHNYEDVLRNVSRLMAAHSRTLTGINKRASELAKPMSDAVVTCCDPPACNCNYPGQTGKSRSNY